MYIFIFEDGTIKKGRMIISDDLLSVEDGILEIIDITEPKKPLYYHGDGEWKDLESAE